MPTPYWFGNGLDAITSGAVDLATATLHTALLSSSYTPNQLTNSSWAAIQGNEVSGTGYTAGGKEMTAVTWAYDPVTGFKTLDADDVEWPSSTIAGARWGVIRAGDVLVVLLDKVQERSSNNGMLALNWHEDGIIRLRPALLGG